MNKKTRVLVTGASRGIGLALVENFLADDDSEVVAVSRISRPERLSKAFDSRLHWITADISTDLGRQAVAGQVNQMGGLDILIHNAGALVYKPFKEIDEKDLHRVYNVNVFAPFLLTQVLMPYLGKTHVVAVSSVGGVGGSVKFPGLSAYSSSKGALNVWIEVMAAEFAGSELTFNALALGSVETEMFASAFPGAVASCSSEAMARFIVDFSRNMGDLIKGKIIPVSSSNP